MLEENVYHRFFRGVVIRIKPKLLKVFVLTNHFLGAVRNEIYDPLKSFATQWCFEIFNDIELDVSLTQ